MELTPFQFHDRINDIAEVRKALEGEGKGRTVRNRRAWRERLKRMNKPVPKGWR